MIINMNELMGAPNEKQHQFLLDHHRHVAYGGARGGGKSWAIRYKAILLALRYDGIKILIVRKTYQELINNHINPLRGVLHGIAVYNKTEKQFTFPRRKASTPSTIKFGYCASDSDLDQYQGAEYDVIFLDEATQLKEEWITKINAAVRGTNDFPKRTYYTCNPGGVSHGYIKRLFIDREFREGEEPDNYSFTQALVTDNTALMALQPEYKRDLEILPEKLKRAWLYGDWDIFDGMFFEDFVVNPSAQKCREHGITTEEAKEQGRWCHVIKPFNLNSGERRGWRILRSYDFGYAKPFSCAWWAVDYDGTLYRIMELYGCTKEPNEGVKWTPDEQARQISEIEHSHPWLKGRKIDGVADPAIWDASRGESIAETMSSYGVYFTPGDNDRIPGWMQVHYRLQFDDNGYARMYIFDTCKGFIRTIPTLMYSDTRPEDLDTSLEDHIADETRYLCMSRPIKPMREPERKIYLSDPLDQIKPRRRQ